MTGSFNLTYTGLFRNREVLESWCWPSADSPDVHLLFEWIDFLKQHYLQESRESAASALKDAVATMEKRVADWSRPANPSSHFLASGYGAGAGLDSLADHWRRWYPDRQPVWLLAVSPFFDESPQSGSLADELRKRFSSIENIEIITDEIVGSNLSKAHFGSDRALSNCALRLIPAVLSGEERERISRQSGENTKDLTMSRTLHAKVLILSSLDGTGLAYMGSANFSKKAWLGDNRELGLVWRIGNSTVLREQMLDAFSVAADNYYLTLPPLPPEKLPLTDDESYDDDVRFPGFIDFIVLEPLDNSSGLAFSVHGNSLENLDHYDIRWSDLTLRFTDGQSQSFTLEKFRNALLGGRTIEFRPRYGVQRSFWFPFQYAGELIADREALMHVSSWDWLSFYLNPDSGEVGDDPEGLSGVSGGTPQFQTEAAADVNRDANCVISMQRYLSLFSKVESAFHARLNLVLQVEDSAARVVSLNSLVVSPLAGLATLLEREPSGRPEDRLFKLGELRRLLSALAELMPAREQKSFVPLLERIEIGMRSSCGSDLLSRRYLAFICQQDKSP